MNIAIYCSASSNLPRELIDDATHLGAWIGANSCRLVYGGVDAGLMSAVASAAKTSGAEIVGVVPVRRYDKESPLNDVSIHVAELSDRKRTMELLADVFIALPGGFGTLDELMSAFAHLNFTGLSKPVLLYNAGGIFDPLLEQFDLMVERGMMAPHCLSVLHVADSMPRLVEILNNILNNKEI